MTSRKVVILSLVLVGLVAIGSATYFFITSPEEGELDIQDTNVEYSITKSGENTYTVRTNRTVDQIRLVTDKGSEFSQNETQAIQITSVRDPVSATAFIIVDGKEIKIGDI